MGLRLGARWIDGSSIRERRRRLERLCSYLPVPPRTVARRSLVDHIPIELVGFSGSDPARTILYLHGGAFCLSSARSHRGLVARICQVSGARAVSVDYRLAPEHPFPAGLEDVLAVYRRLIDGGLEPRRCAFAGDSAGGNLALAAMVALRDAGEPLPAAAVLLSPATDLTGSSRSIDACARLDPYLRREVLMPFRKAYVSDRDVRDPRASPLLANLAGLPPMLVQVGTHEILRDDSIRLARRAQAAGVEVTLEIAEGMWHVWQMAAPFVPEARSAIRRMGTFLRATIPPAEGGRY